MLEYHPEKRISAAAAMQSAFFDSVPEAIKTMT
jgi:hypothetical protein